VRGFEFTPAFDEEAHNSMLERVNAILAGPLYLRMIVKIEDEAPNTSLLSFVLHGDGV
jgi:hypothetical protein